MGEAAWEGAAVVMGAGEAEGVTMRVATARRVVGGGVRVTSARARPRRPVANTSIPSRERLPSRNKVTKDGANRNGRMG